MSTTENKENNSIEILVPFILNYEDFENLMCGAIEGGSNDWAEINSDALPDIIKEKYKGKPFSVKVCKAIWEGHNVTVYDAEDSEGPWIVNLESLKKGLNLFATEQKEHFNNFVNENDDATTSDVFFQLITIGEVMFG